MQGFDFHVSRMIQNLNFMYLGCVQYEKNIYKFLCFEYELVKIFFLCMNITYSIFGPELTI